MVRTREVGVGGTQGEPRRLRLPELCTAAQSPIAGSTSRLTWHDLGVQRAVDAGYRDDWRGVVAYAASPELWDPLPYVVFACNVIAISVGAIVGAARSSAPILGVPVEALVVYFLFARPLWRVRQRRAARLASSASA